MPRVQCVDLAQVEVGITLAIHHTVHGAHVAYAYVLSSFSTLKYNATYIMSY